MAVQTNGHKTFEADAAIADYTCVKLDGASGSLVINTISDEAPIGIAQPRPGGVADGDPVTVRLISRGRTFKVTANEALAEGASLFTAAAGKVTDTDPGGGTVRFLAIDAATADGSIIEVLAV